MVFKNIKKVCLLSLFLFCISLFLGNIAYCGTKNSDTKVLVLGSYSNADNWESSVIRGIKDTLGDSVTIYTEFLDSTMNESLDYEKNFVNMLNSKYTNESINYIVTLDDEGFTIARRYILTPGNLFYKKQIIFSGVYNMSPISKEEEPYLSGIFNKDNNTISTINMILASNSKIKDIYFILDNSKYSSIIEWYINNNYSAFIRPINAHIIKEASLNTDNLSQLDNINDKTSAICISGRFINQENKAPINNSLEIIKSIQKLTSAPIYTTIPDYIIAGAIGGITDDGYKVGTMLADFILNLISGKQKFSIISPNQTFSVPFINYRAMRRYNINPWKLPKDSIYINKRALDLLVPAYVECLIFLFVLFIIAVFTYAIFIILNNIREEKENKTLVLSNLNKERNIDNLILTISDKLRNSLSVIQNTSEMLKLKIKNSEFEENYFLNKLESILENSSKLKRTVNNTITTLELELDNTSVNISNVNIVALIEEVSLYIANKLSNYKTDLIFDTDDEELLLATDKYKIIQILSIFIANTFKFSKENSLIKVYLKNRNSEYIEVNIINTGVIISKSSLESIRDTLKSKTYLDVVQKESYKILGFDIYLSKKLLDLIQGKLYIDSSSDKGTIITFTLPIYTVDEESPFITPDNLILKDVIDLEFVEAISNKKI